MRDNQREKVYRAENTWRRADTHEHKSIVTRDSGTAEVEALYEMLAAEFGTTVPPVRVNGRKKRFSGTCYWDRIELMPGASVDTALHEFAHWMPGSVHGWKFARNLIDVVELWYGTRSANILKNSFRKHGVIWHRDDHIAQLRKAQVAEDKRMARHGETGTVWILKTTSHDRDVTYACNQAGWHAFGLSRAGAWRRRSTAEKKAEQRSYGRVLYEVTEAKGVYDAYTNRWRATEESVVGSDQGLVVSA